MMCGLLASHEKLEVHPAHVRCAYVQKLQQLFWHLLVKV